MGNVNYSSYLSNSEPSSVGKQTCFLYYRNNTLKAFKMVSVFQFIGKTALCLQQQTHHLQTYYHFKTIF